MKFKAKAFAKTNLFLDVIGKRPDGYHNIDSVMQSISLYDEIEISDNSSTDICITYNDPSLDREDDIIYKACEAYFDYSGWRTGLNIRIVKNIPILAGLGGFSTDIAAVLRVLNLMSGRNYPDDEMIPLCAKLGADVPFCYLGGTARAGGIGDKLTKLPMVDAHFVILKERAKQSTKDMYNMLDGFALNPNGRIDDMIDGLDNNDSLKVISSAYNAFELCWEMDAMLSPFAQHKPDNSFLSGSGPAVIAAFVSYDRALDCYDALKKAGRNVYFASAVDTGFLIV